MTIVKSTNVIMGFLCILHSTTRTPDGAKITSSATKVRVTTFCTPSHSIVDVFDSVCQLMYVILS